MIMGSILKERTCKVWVCLTKVSQYMKARIDTAARRKDESAILVADYNTPYHYLI